MKALFAVFFYFLSSTAFAQQKIKPEEATKHVGDSVQVCGKVFGGKYLGSKLTLLNVGGNYPDNPFTVVVPSALRDSLGIAPEVKYRDQDMCFAGRVVLYRDKPQLVLSQLSQIAYEAILPKR